MSIHGGFLMPHPPIVIPEVGQGRESECQNTVDGMNRAAREIKKIAPETIVLITPHGPTFTDAIAIYDDSNLRGDLSKFGASSVTYEKEADDEFIDELLFICGEKNIPAVRIDKDLRDRFGISKTLDHGAVVPYILLIKCISPINWSA